MSLTADLLKLADTYSGHTGRSRARVATIIFNDGKKFELLENGADVATRSYERAMLWFSENWPDGLRWPDGIERPEPEAEPVSEDGAAA